MIISTSVAGTLKSSVKPLPVRPKVPMLKLSSRMILYLYFLAMLSSTGRSVKVPVSANKPSVTINLRVKGAFLRLSSLSNCSKTAAKVEVEFDARRVL